VNGVLMYFVEKGDARRVDSLIAFMSSTEQGLCQRMREVEKYRTH